MGGVEVAVGQNGVSTVFGRIIAYFVMGRGGVFGFKNVWFADCRCWAAARILVDVGKLVGRVSKINSGFSTLGNCKVGAPTMTESPFGKRRRACVPSALDQTILGFTAAAGLLCAIVLLFLIRERIFIALSCDI
jgi:hypothetical protein